MATPSAVGADLNDILSVGSREVRRLSEDDTELLIDVKELIWEPTRATNSFAR